MERYPPPLLEPDEMPSPEQVALLAREFLGEMAQHDPDLAKRLREYGISDDRS